MLLNSNFLIVILMVTTAFAPVQFQLMAQNKQQSAPAAKLMEFNYSEPTSVGDIIRDNIDTWPHLNFVVAPDAGPVKMTIISGRPVTPQAAYDMFISALALHGLRAAVAQVNKHGEPQLIRIEKRPGSQSLAPAPAP